MVGIATLGTTNVLLQNPRGKWASTGVGAAQGAAVGLEVPGHDPFSVFFAGCVSAVGIPVGATIGYFKGMPAEEVKAARLRLLGAVAQARLEELLRAQLLAFIKSDTHQPAVFAELTNGVADFNRVTYLRVTNQGFDTVLEASLTGAGLSGERARKAPLQAWASVTIRLVRVADGVELYKHSAVRRGRTHIFSEWAAEGGQPFRRELEKLVTNIAEEVVWALFVLRT